MGSVDSRLNLIIGFCGSGDQTSVSNKFLNFILDISKCCTSDKRV
jgi:hypothetical protein